MLADRAEQQTGEAAKAARSDQQEIAWSGGADEDFGGSPLDDLPVDLDARGLVFDVGEYPFEQFSAARRRSLKSTPSDAYEPNEPLPRTWAADTTGWSAKRTCTPYHSAGSEPSPPTLGLSPIVAATRISSDRRSNRP